MNPLLISIIILAAAVVVCGLGWYFVAEERNELYGEWADACRERGRIRQDRDHFEHEWNNALKEWTKALHREEAGKIDLDMIKVAIWGTSGIDRNAADIVKLIHEWRAELSAEPEAKKAKAFARTAINRAFELGRIDSKALHSLHAIVDAECLLAKVDA